MVEIEIAVLAHDGLDRRLATAAAVACEVAAWERDRNLRRATVNWRFSDHRCANQTQAPVPFISSVVNH